MMGKGGYVYIMTNEFNSVYYTRVTFDGLNSLVIREVEKIVECTSGIKGNAREIEITLPSLRGTKQSYNYGWVSLLVH
jgi:hypothetical protein